jgi:hypothetical protein
MCEQRDDQKHSRSIDDMLMELFRLSNSEACWPNSIQIIPVWCNISCGGAHVQPPVQNAHILGRHRLRQSAALPTLVGPDMTGFKPPMSGYNDSSYCQDFLTDFSAAAAK